MSETTSVTRMITGGSLNPDSASSVARVRARSRSLRITANTAAASVEDTTAPSSMAVRASTSSTSQASAEVTVTLIATPTVARTPANPSTGRITGSRVVRPPSARITAKATVHRVWVSAASSKESPRPASPMDNPIARYSNRLGRPARVETRTAATPSSSTAMAPRTTTLSSAVVMRATGATRG
jgi:hypothetical protein